MCTALLLAPFVLLVVIFVGIAWNSARHDFKAHKKLMNYHGRDRRGNWK